MSDDRAHHCFKGCDGCDEPYPSKNNATVPKTPSPSLLWKVVAHEDCSYLDDPERKVWTISQTNDPGWETDCGHPGYGVPKITAEDWVIKLNSYAAHRALIENQIQWLFAKGYETEARELRALLGGGK